MDKFILSQLLKELILENGQVVLPGFGIIGTEPVPSSFADEGRIINPPTKKLIFKGDTSAEDTLLTKRYADRLNEPEDSLRESSEAFIRELASEVLSHGSAALPGLGSIVYSAADGFSFIQEPGKDIFAERDGLEPIRLRIVERETAQEEATPRTEAIPVPESEPEPEPEPDPEPEPELKSEPGYNPGPKAGTSAEEKAHRIFAAIIIILLIVIVAAVLFILGYNGVFDSLLYSEEELDIIRSAR